MQQLAVLDILIASHDRGSTESPQRHVEELDILSSRDRDYISKRVQDVDAHEDHGQWLLHSDVTTLRMAGNVSWKDQMTSTEIHGNIVSEKIKSRRLTLAGYCLRHTELPVSKVIACVPSHGSLNPPWLRNLIENQVER